MRNFFLSLLAILFLTGCTGIRNVPHTQIIPKLTEKIYRGKTEPILRIKACDFRSNFIVSSCGTAFVTKYKQQTVIVTAFHVTAGANVFQFSTIDRKRVNVLIRKIHFLPNLDTTVFFVSHISAEIVPLEFNKIKFGDSCTTTGFPSDAEKKVYSGNILSSFLSSSARVDVGMSGGPVISDGKVVGVVSAKVVTSDGFVKSQLIRLSDVFDTIGRDIK